MSPLVMIRCNTALGRSVQLSLGLYGTHKIVLMIVLIECLVLIMSHLYLSINPYPLTVRVLKTAFNTWGIYVNEMVLNLLVLLIFNSVKFSVT